MEEYSLKYIKSKYILKQITDHLTKNKLLKIINYNKLIQNKLDIGIIDYKKYYEQIEIELIPINEDNINYFINIKDEHKSYYHIYFNNDKNEKKQNYFNKNDNITKINIIIDNEIKSFEKLFYKCKCIEKIRFIKYNRNDINNMSYMFSVCSSLKELNLNNFNTINVTNMIWMFEGCSDDLTRKIKSENKNIKDEVFIDDD